MTTTSAVTAVTDNLGHDVVEPLSTSRVVRWLPILLITVAAFLQLIKLPNLFLLGAYAFGDQGAGLTADRLVASGERPGVDFNYLYGLMPLAVSRGVYALFGCSP